VPPSIEGLRTNYAKWSEEQNKDLPQIGSYEEGVTLRPGLRADVAVPKGPGPHPVLLYIHGGGWMAGSAHTHKKVAAEIAARGYLTFNLDYRLAPEHPFPAGLDDCALFRHCNFPLHRNSHKICSRRLCCSESVNDKPDRPCRKREAGRPRRRSSANRIAGRNDAFSRLPLTPSPDSAASPRETNEARYSD
jgi:hypothetical protein